MQPLITFSNPTIVDWLESKGIQGERKQYATVEDVLHRHVYGNIPYWLAAYAEKVSEVHLPRLAKADRTRLHEGEMSVSEMDAAGAHVSTYQVRRL